MTELKKRNGRIYGGEKEGEHLLMLMLEKKKKKERTR
jgi:hypothetical protein